MFSEKYCQAAQYALAIQSASNLSGVLLSLPSVVEALNERKRELGKGTDWFNKHPVMYLLTIQMAHLTGTGSDGEDYAQMLKRCEAIADNDFNNKWAEGL